MRTMRSVAFIMLWFAIIAWVTQPKPIGEVLSATADPTTSSSNPGVDPRTVFAPFLQFVDEASGQFPSWKPRCRLLPLCGAQHKGGASQDDDALRRAQPDLLAGSQVCGPLPRAVVCPSGSCGSINTDRSVWFNPAAANFITSILSGGQVPATISFPPGSLIARPVWIIVRQDTHFGTPNMASLAIYDPRVRFCPNNPGADQLGLFPHRTVDLNDQSCDHEVPGGPIPLGCFYHLQITSASDISRYQTDRLSIRMGDTLVLLGFHLIDKVCKSPNCTETEWNFATFWWQDIPGGINGRWPCEFSKALCDKIPPGWKHYRMNRVDLPVERNTQIVPVFNPYIEGAVGNNANLNCAVCHAFAAVPEMQGVKSSLQFGARGVTTKAQVAQSRSAYMAHRIPTDNSWSVADFLTRQLQH